MPAAPYINDNPYRLLGIGSATLQSELQQAAEFADKSVKIGIPPTSGLMQEFGAGLMSSCLERVQVLGADSMERTISRLFWPFDYQRLPNFNGTLADLLQSDSLESAPDFRILQLRFVITWIKYILQPSAQKVQEALDSFDNLCKVDAFYEFLEELLLNEGVEAAQANQIANHAPAMALDRLLMVFRRQAAQWWESGEIDAVTDLVRRLSEAGFEKEVLDKIFGDLVTCGEQEATRIRSLIQSFQGWHASQPPLQPTEVAKLHQAALALKEHVPEAQGWLQVVEERVRQVVGAMRDQALEVASRAGDGPFALQILLHLQAFPLPVDLKQELASSAGRLHNRLKAEQEEIWRDFTPVQDNPGLTTINGIGGMVYGRTPFAGDPEWYLTTYYFVLLFIPVFPIRRYLVKDAPGGGWYFRASAPLTKGHKIHIIVSMVLATLLLAYAVVVGGNSQRTPDNSDYSRYGSRYSTGENGYSSPYQPDKKEASPEQVALEAEVAPLNTEIYRQQKSLEQRRSDLDIALKQLDADKKRVNRYSRSAVRAYNARVDALQKKGRQYDADVKAYKAKVKKAEAMEKRIRVLKNLTP